MQIFEDENYVKNLNKILKNGGVVAFVTDTVWGIGCLPESQIGVERIYEIKNREKNKPLILMSDKFEKLEQYVKNISVAAKKLVDKHFPGALTLILEKSDKTKNFVTSDLDTVGVRVPDNVFFQKLCSVIDGGVLATTSANLSHQPSAKNFDTAKKYIGNKVDYIFNDFGYPCEGLESTVASVISGDIKIYRQGAIKL